MDAAGHNQTSEFTWLSVPKNPSAVLRSLKLLIPPDGARGLTQLFYPTIAAATILRETYSSLERKKAKMAMMGVSNWYDSARPQKSVMDTLKPPCDLRRTCPINECAEMSAQHGIA